MSKLDLSIIISFVDKATQPIRQFQRNLQNTNQSIDRLTQSLDRLERSVNGGRSFKQYSRNLQTGSSNINQHNGALNNMHHGYDKVSTALDTVRNKTEAWSETLKSNRAQMREEFKSLAINSAIAGAGLYKFLKPAIDFEKQMSGVQSVLDLEKHSQAMKQLTADARKWGAASSFSPGEAAQAQFALGSGGFNADQIHKALGGTLQLAEAGKVELERAAQIAVGTLNGFGLAADKIGRVNDVFLKGTNLTATSVDGLGETMKYVAPIAKAYGASIEQATAMTGLLGNSNIVDTQAGTSLRSIMTRFAAPPKEAQKAFTKLKIETADANGNLRDMSDILAEVNKATANMGSKERLDIFKDIAGQEAISGFAVLVDQSALFDKNTGKTVNKIKELTAQLEDSEGAAARAAAILKDNLAGDIEQLGGSIQDLSISVLNALGSDIRSFVTSLGAFIDRIKVWVEANPELVRTISNLLIKLLMFKVAMLSLRYTGNLFFGTIFSLIAGVTKFAIALWLLNKAADKFGIRLPTRLNLIAKAARYLGQVFIFLTRQALPLLIVGLRLLAISLLTNPLTLYIALIAALALAIYKYWQPIKAFIHGFVKGFQDGFSATKIIISDFGEVLKSNIEPLQPILNWINQAFTVFKGVLSEILSPLQSTSAELKNANSYGYTFGLWVSIVTSALIAMKVALIAVTAIKAIFSFLTLLTVGFSTASVAAWRFSIAILTVGLNTLKASTMMVGSRVLAFLTLLKAQFISSAIAAWAFITPFLPIIAAVSLLALAVFLIYKNWAPIKEFFSNLLESISAKFDEILENIKAKWARIGMWFSNIWTEIKAFFNSGISNISATILNWSPLGLFYSVFAKVLSWFGIELPAKFTGFGAMILDGLKNGILSRVQAVKDAISSAVSGIIEKAQGLLGIHSPSRVFMGIGDYTMQGMALGIAAANNLPLIATKNATQNVVKTAVKTQPVKPISRIGNGSAKSLISQDNIEIHIHVKDGSVVKGTAEALRQELKRVAQEEQNAKRKFLTDTE